MSCSKRLALAGDVLFYLNSAGIKVSYEESLELAGSLLDDGGWDITFLAGSESTESGCFADECCDREPSPPVPAKQDAAEAALALHADEFAQKVVDAVKAHLEKLGVEGIASKVVEEVEEGAVSFTPTTLYVRDAWINDQEMAWGVGAGEPDVEFDRWLAAYRSVVIKEVLDEVRMIPCWAPAGDRDGGDFDLPGESSRQFVLETIKRLIDGVKP